MSRLTKAFLSRSRRIARFFGPRVHSVQGSSERKFFKHFAFKVGSEEFDPSGNHAVADLMRHFGQRVAGDWPPIPDAITDLRIDLSQMTDDEIIRRADEALDGDLHPSGLRPFFKDHGGLDWASNPSESREWLLMIHRHAWWLIWGAAYQRTGDEKYTEAFISQLVDWIDQHPLPQQKSENIESWRLMEAGLRMRITWIPVFACFYHSPRFTEAAKLKMLRAFYDHGQYLNQFFTNRNHLVRESNGLIALGLCFSEFRQSGEWVERGLRRLDSELQAQVNMDGSQIEMSVGYQWLTIEEFEATSSLLSKYQRKLPISDLDEALRRMYEFLTAVIRPDRTFPQLNDGFILWDARRLAEAGRRHGWTDIEYVGSGGGSGSLPDYCSRSYPNAGVHVMRSDWTQNARYMIADTGPYGGPHGHEDKLSFELFAYGAAFIVDPGSYTYKQSDPYRNYFVGSQGHNSVLVNQGSQVRRWNSQHMTPVVEDEIHGAWCSDEKLDVASGRYDEGYAPYALTRPADVDVNFDVTHQRDFVFVKPDYWIVADYLDASELHEYNFLFHLAPDVLVENLTGSTALLRSARNGARLVLEVLTDPPMSSEVIEGSESPIQGWYSEDHHKKCSSPVLSFSIDKACTVFVAWVLYPQAPGSDAMQIKTSMVYEPEAGKRTIYVQRGGLSDRVRLPDNANTSSDDESTRVAKISLERRHEV